MKTRLYTIIALICIIACSCKNNNGQQQQQDSVPAFEHTECNGIYYWKTVLDLDSMDYSYLKKHKIERVYMRFFDVVLDGSPLSDYELMPNATIQIGDSVALSNVVPTIYITLDALEVMQGHEKDWADKIVLRVDNMYSYHELGELQEIQLDCDWTQSTQPIFFELCKAVKETMKKHNPQSSVSSTIRLHQLSQTPPPVDYGVMMLYNTGSFSNPEVKNSILNVADVKPYLKHLSGYPLHLDFAYPTYSWNLVFRDNKFYGILRNEISEFGSSISKLSDNQYLVKEEVIVGEELLHKGDVIRQETSPYSTIIEVKKLIDDNLKSKPHSNILYHYDAKNLSKYTDDEIASLFNN